MTSEPWYETAIRDHEREHGPSGGSWNISMVLQRLHAARPPVPDKLTDVALTNAIWDKLNTIDTAVGEGDTITTYAQLRSAVSKALASLNTAPAGDDVRQAALEEVARIADELVNGGGLRTVAYADTPKLVVVERKDKSDPHYRLCDALAALKATTHTEEKAK